MPIRMVFRIVHWVQKVRRGEKVMVGIAVSPVVALVAAPGLSARSEMLHPGPHFHLP
jgi:hypothetical protein